MVKAADHTPLPGAIPEAGKPRRVRLSPTPPKPPARPAWNQISDQSLTALRATRSA